MSQLLVLYLGSLILRSMGIAAIAAVCCWKIRNVAVRHAVWVIVLGAMLVMPVLDYLLPASWVPAPVQVAAEQSVTFSAVSLRVPPVLAQNLPLSHPVQSKRVDWWSIAITLYALVSLAMFARLAFGYRRLWKLRRRARQISSSVWDEIAGSHLSRWRTAVLLESNVVRVPITIGVVRPAVILPSDWGAWDDWKLRAVLLHEFAHVRRCDWGIAVIAAMARSAYWLNPYSWLIERRLSELAEQASDDASMDVTQDTTRYAEVLLQFAVAAQDGGRLMKGGVAMAQRNMKARIERVLNNTKTGTGFLKMTGWMFVLVIAVPVIYSAAALQVRSEPALALTPTNAASFGPNGLAQLLTDEQRAGLYSVQENASQSKPNSSASIRDLRQLEVENQKLQRQVVDVQAKLQTLQEGNQINGGPIREPPNNGEVSVTADSLREELIRAERQLTAMQGDLLQQGQANTIPQQVERLERLRVELIGSISRLESEKQAVGGVRGVPATSSRSRIFVTGRVQKAGDFESNEPLTVLQALALAGGFQDYARPDAISVIRMNGDSSTLLRFNYSEVIKGVNSSQNIYLANGDVVVVP